MSGTARPHDSGRRDALGRVVRVSDSDTVSRADAPTPPAGNNDGDDGPYRERYGGQPTWQVARAVESAVAQLPGNVRIISSKWDRGRYLIDVDHDATAETDRWKNLERIAGQLSRIGYSTSRAGVWLEIESVRPNDINLLLNTTNPTDDDWAIDELGRREGLTLRVTSSRP